MDNLWILVKVLFGEIDQLNNVVEIGFVWQASFKRPDLLSRLLEMSLLEILVGLLAWCDCLFSYRIVCSFSFFVGWRWHGRDAGKKWKKEKFCVVTPPNWPPPKRATADDGNTNSEIKLTCRHASLQERAAMDDDGMKAQALTSREQTAEISVKNMFMQFTLWHAMFITEQVQCVIVVTTPPISSSLFLHVSTLSNHVNIWRGWDPINLGNHAV